MGEGEWHREVFHSPLMPLQALLAHLRELGASDSDLCWVVGDDTLVGLTRAWGIDIVRADVPAPLLAFRSLSAWRRPDAAGGKPWPDREDLPDE